MGDETCELLCLDLPRAEALRHARRPLSELVVAAEAAKALADPTRLTVALALRDGGELCVCDLAWCASARTSSFPITPACCARAGWSNPAGSGRWCSTR